MIEDAVMSAINVSRECPYRGGTYCHGHNPVPMYVPSHLKLFPSAIIQGHQTEENNVSCSRYMIGDDQGKVMIDSFKFQLQKAEKH